MKKAKRSVQKEKFLQAHRPRGRYPARYSDRLLALQHRIEAELEASEVAGSPTVTYT